MDTMGDVLKILSDDNKALRARVDALETVLHNADKLHREIAEALGRKDMPNDLLVPTANGLRARVEELEKAAWLAEVAVLIVEWMNEGDQRPFSQWESVGLIYDAALAECEEVGK